MYQKEIIYMGLYKNGTRIGSAGFVKVESREQASRLYLKTQNIPHSINGRFPIRVYNGSDWKELNGITIQDGGGIWEDELAGRTNHAMLQVMLPGGYLLEGKSKSAAESHSEGIMAGNTESYNKGAMAGNTESYNKGAMAGNRESYNEGVMAGNTESHDEGVMAGNTESHDEGVMAGNTESHNEGVMAGNTEAHNEDIIPGDTGARSEVIVQQNTEVHGENTIRKGAVPQDVNATQKNGVLWNRQRIGNEMEERRENTIHIDSKTRRESIMSTQQTQHTDKPPVVIVTEELPRRMAQEERSIPENTAVYPLKEDKWEQILDTYEQIHPYGDERVYVKLEPKDFVILQANYQHLVNNSFLLHGFYNYRYVILGKEQDYYLGVPGVFYEREKMVALMFGFEAFECPGGNVRAGEFGYYLRRVEL